MQRRFWHTHINPHVTGYMIAKRRTNVVVSNLCPSRSFNRSKQPWAYTARYRPYVLYQRYSLFGRAGKIAHELDRCANKAVEAISIRSYVTHSEASLSALGAQF